MQNLQRNFLSNTTPIGQKSPISVSCIITKFSPRTGVAHKFTLALPAKLGSHTHLPFRLASFVIAKYEFSFVSYTTVISYGLGSAFRQSWEDTNTATVAPFTKLKPRTERLISSL